MTTVTVAAPMRSFNSMEVAGKVLSSQQYFSKRNNGKKDGNSAKDIFQLMAKSRCVVKVCPEFEDESNPEESYEQTVQGLAGVLYAAYTQELEVVLSPDVVWNAIVTQLSLYINARGELLRSKLVNHSEKQLTIVVDLGMDVMPNEAFGMLPEFFIEEAAKTMASPEMAEWFCPTFSGSTSTETVAHAITAMGCMKSYYKYDGRCGCGLPKVHLLGSPEDWGMILTRIENLDALFGFEGPDPLAESWAKQPECSMMAAWTELLTPIVQECVRVSEGADPDLDFWERVCAGQRRLSGVSDQSGWCTVFSVFDEQGRWRGGDMKVGTSVTAKKWPVINSPWSSGVSTCPFKLNDILYTYYSGIALFSSANRRGLPNAIEPRIVWFITPGHIANSVLYDADSD